MTCIAMFLLSGCGATKIDISEYVNVSYTGINGRALATVDVDFDALENIVLGEGGENIDKIYQLAALEESVKCKLSKDEELSNGDSINITIKWNEDTAKKCGVKLTGSEKTIKVSGLEEGKIVDLFSDIEIDFSGVAPEAKASVRNTSRDSYVSSIYYSVEPAVDIANGDEIIVTANCDVAAAERKGYIINETEKKYTVEGIDEYIISYEGIDEETRTKMDAQARDIIEAKLADKYEYVSYMYPNKYYFSEEDQEIIDIKLNRAYFFCLKDGLKSDSFGTVRNSVFLVYEVSAIDSRSPEGKTTYFPVYFSDFIKRDTGNLDVSVTNARISYDTYDTLDDLYREIVTANKDRYIFEEIIY